MNNSFFQNLKEDQMLYLTEFHFSSILKSLGRDNFGNIIGILWKVLDV